MKYNLVLHDKDWVMEKLVNHFAKYLPNSYITFREPSNEDINFYFNWHGLSRKTKFDIGFFTHIESRPYWDTVVKLSDIAVLLGGKYKDTVPEEKRILFYPPPFENFLSARKNKILIVGREYSSGRKNSNIIPRLLTVQGIDIKFTGGKLTEEQLEQAYRDTDYVLVTSKIESGPMCVVEAIAMGKPVIAPDVGWCYEYPVIKYNNEDHLVELLEKLSFKEDSWKVAVEELHSKIVKIYNN